MRTDSTNLADVAVQAARDLVRTEYGNDYLPDRPPTYASKVKNAQEAHEAIRPAGHPFELPSALSKTLSAEEFKIFEMIWKRTIASQMKEARGRNLVVTIEGDGVVFRASGRVIDFPGYLRAYVEGSDDPDAELANKERILPPLAIGEVVDCRKLEAKDHTTQPPARFSEASLTKELESRGIGRPSTFASIIDTILARNYVFKKGNALVPTWTAFSVVTLMERHLPKLVDYDFTAEMEEELDAISRGEMEHVKYLEGFYFGDESSSRAKPGLKKQLDHKIEEIDAREVSRFSLGAPTTGDHREEVFVRVGRYGPFLEQGERKASIREDMPPDEINLATALEMLDRAKQDEEPIGYHPETNQPVYMKQGRFGPYIQLGMPDDEDKKNASLLKGMEPGNVDLDVALRLLSLPRTLGEHPQIGQPVQAFNGRYGPYVKCGDETRSLPAEVSPIEVTLQQALDLLAQPKQNRGRGRGAPREPLRTFDASPVTGQPIKLFEGRYGPYVADGETNASLPKELPPAELTFERAVELLAERAAKGGGKRPAKRSAKKKAPAKKAKKKAKAE
jgi:DNA topoisomerase-1